MMRIKLIALLLLITTSLLSAQSAAKPGLLIMDVVSETLNVAESKLLTEVLRTELFKLNVFEITAVQVEMELGEEASEAGMRVARETGAERLLVFSLDTVFDSVILNLRIVDVETELIDFTDNLFVDDRANLFAAVSELITKISVFYIVSEASEDGKLSDAAIAERWKLVGAADSDIDDLLKIENGLSEFFTLRQYDINFGVLDYLQVKKANWEIESIRLFLQSGIPYRTVADSFRLGIVNLDNYRTSFEPAGIAFDEYLEAYKLEIVTADEYLRYQEGYKRIRFGLGLGYVADGIPIATAEFKAPVVHLSIEYFISKFQRETWKYGLETGFAMFYGIVPVYVLQANAYVGQYPLMAKVAVGGMAEVFVGGIVAGLVRVGVEFFERFEFVLTGFVGTQNKYYYDIDRWGEEVPEDEGIQYPIFAAEFVYKF